MPRLESAVVEAPARRERASSWRAALIERQSDCWERVREHGDHHRAHLSKHATYVVADALQWLAELPENSLHAVVTQAAHGNDVLGVLRAARREKLLAGRPPRCIFGCCGKEATDEA